MDPNYECDAPTYVDFETVKLGMEDDEGVDQWFEQKCSFPEDTMYYEESTAARTFSDNFAPLEGGEEEEEEEEEEVEAVRGAEEEKATTEEAQEDEKDEEKEKVQRGRKRKAAIASLYTPAMKQRKVQRVAAKKAAASISSVLSTPKTARCQKTSEAHSVQPKTPQHLRRYLAKKQNQVAIKSKEEMEEEEIKKLQEETKKKLRQNRRSLHHLKKASCKPHPPKYSKPTTEAVGFNFRTDRRLRRRAAMSGVGRSQNCRATDTKAFPMTLRSGREIQHEIAPKSTKVQPFKFALDTRLAAKVKETKTGDATGGDGDRGDGRKFVPTAEYIYKLQKQTPERFWSLKRKREKRDDIHSSLEVSSHASHHYKDDGLTIPYTPKLQTKTRARPTTTKSTEEIEEEEMAKIKEHTIKPCTLNPKIFTEQGRLGIPKLTPRPVTQPHTPKLATEERMQAKMVKGEAEEKSVGFTFKAKPLPKEILEMIKGVPEKHPPPLTRPKSPALELKKRKLNNPPSCSVEEDEGCNIIVAHPVPDFSRTFKPQLYHKKTEVEPFTFEERDKNKPSKATLVQQILQRDTAAKPFKAQPLPEFGTPVLPEKASMSITQPSTPHLRTKTRGEEHSSKWREKVDGILREEKEAANFHATDSNTLYKPPFIPTKSEHKPLLESSNIVLHSQIRSMQRAKFEAEKQEREQQQKQENHKRLALAAAQEAKEIAQLRRSLVHRAQDAPHHAPVFIKPSMLPLTSPRSPHFTLPARGYK